MAGTLANNGKPLGKLRGVFFTNSENRNDYPCDDASARSAERDDLLKEKLITGGVIGRIDHINMYQYENPNDETLVKEAVVNMRKFPKKNNKGQYIGECIILDNLEGQHLYAYCKSGKKPGISYRGGIDQEAYERGDIEGAWRQFTIEGFDIVYVPAYRECYLDLVEDYLDPESECYIEFKEEYLDNDAPIIKKASYKRKADFDVKSAARAVLKVSANKKGAKDIVREMAKKEHFTEKEMILINRELDRANIDGDRRTREQAKELSRPYDASPKHTWARQTGNGTLNMHHEEDVYGEDDVDIITGKKIETLNTGNENEEDIGVIGYKTEKQIKKAGVEKGTVAFKRKRKDEELEGYIDKDGNAIKKSKAGMYRVESDEDTEVEQLTENGILNLDFEPVDNKSENKNATYEDLVFKIEELTSEINKLRESLYNKKNTLKNRDLELKDLTASYARLKKTVAKNVDRSKNLETMKMKNEKLQERIGSLSKVVSNIKTQNAETIFRLNADKKQLQEKIIRLEKSNFESRKNFKTQANLLNEKKVRNEVLANKENQLGKLCIEMVADLLGVDRSALIAKGKIIKTNYDLKRVIANMQRPDKTENSNYYFETAGMKASLPLNIKEACEKVDWNDEDEIN